MSEYIYEKPSWPHFKIDRERLIDQLAAVRYEQGLLFGRMERLGFSERTEASLRSLTEEAVKSSDIEGERLDPDQVRSSIARHLGIDVAGLVPSDRTVDGVVEMTLDATQKYDEPLSKQRLFRWHAALFPNGRSDMTSITVAGWRKDARGPMQVVSGRIGRENVHYEAPAAPRVDAEMRRFLRWFNGASAFDPVVTAAIAHLWFVTIHPFDDGNGRIARALTDLLLARCEGSTERFYSVSAQIRAERSDYYAVLEATQKGDLDVTRWVRWFVGCMGRAIDNTHLVVGSVMVTAAFWELNRTAILNDRQRRMVAMLLDGFEGKLTSSKWAEICRCSTDTALRDIEALIAQHILERDAGGGRSTSYSLASRSRTCETS